MNAKVGCVVKTKPTIAFLNPFLLLSLSERKVILFPCFHLGFNCGYPDQKCFVETILSTLMAFRRNLNVFTF